MTTNFQFRVVTEPDGLDRPDLDEVRVLFDWLVPAHADEAITFLLNIMRGTRESLIRFQIDLARLEEGDLQRLHDFLVQQHAALEDDYLFVRGLTWLLTLSLRQQGTAVEQINTKVRELLLTQND